jgi:sporulation protein YlmC with PRC-barrel domain
MKKFMTLCAAVGIASLGSLAQAQVIDRERVQPRPQRSQDPPGFYRAKDIIGMTIRSRDGRVLGKIDDLVIDSRTEQVQYFLLDAGTALKAEGLLIMPFTIVHEHFRVHRARPVKFITVDFEFTELRRAPTITRAKFRTLRDRDVFVRVDKFYKVKRTDRRRDRRDDFDRKRRDRRDDLDRKRDRRNDDRPRTDREKPRPNSLPGLKKDDGKRPKQKPRKDDQG